MVAITFGFSGPNTGNGYADFKALLASEGFQGSMWFIDAKPVGSSQFVFSVYALDYRFPRIYSLFLTDPNFTGASIKPSSFATDFPNAVSMGIDFGGPAFG